MTDPVSDFLDAMGAAGIRPLESIVDKLASGEPVRFRAAGDKPGRRNGWAWLHLDGVPAGVFRHYRLNIRMVWRAGSETCSLSPADRKAMMARARGNEARRVAQSAAKQELAASVARDMWLGSHRADPAHGYLVRKGLCPIGIRQRDDALLVPMFNRSFRLRNLQRIYPNGRKLFLSGGRVEGLFWSHGIFSRDGGTAGPLVIGEGFATMVAIHQATGHSVVAAMSARNLEAVARTMRKLYPDRTLIIAADDDRHLAENVGLNAAQKAAQCVDGLLATPIPLHEKAHPTRFGADFANLSAVDVVDRITLAGEDANA